MYEAPASLARAERRATSRRCASILRKIAPEAPSSRAVALAAARAALPDRARVRASLDAAADRLIPPLDAHPGGAALGVADYVDRLLGAFTFDPPADLRGRTVQRARRRRRVVRRLPAALAPRRARVAHAHRRLAGLARARVQRPDARLAGRSTARASPRSAPTSSTSTATNRTAGSRRPELRAAVLRRTPAKARTARPSTAATATAPAGSRSSSRATCNRAATPTKRCAAVPDRPDCDAVVIGTGPAGATAADVLTERGLVGDHAREGPQPPARARRAVRPARPRRRTTRSSSSAATSSGPIRSSSRARYRRDDGRRRPPVRGRGQQPAVDGRRRRLPRRRQAARAFAPSTSRRAPSSARSTAPTSSTGRSTTTRWSRTTRRPRTLIGVAGPRRREPVRGVAQRARTRCRPAPTCSARCSRPRPRERLGYHPYRAPTGVNSVPYDGRPACNNCGFCGFFGCPIDAKGDPVAPLRNALRTGRCEIRPESYVERVRARRAGPARARRALPRRRRQRARGERARRDRRRAARGRRRGCCCARRSRTRRVSSAATSCTTSRPIVVGSFPFRLHGHRGRSVTHLHDDHMIVDDDVPRASRRSTGSPTSAPASSSTAAAATRSSKAIYTEPGLTHTREMLESPMRDRLWAFTIQGEDLPQVTNRIDLDPARARRVRLPRRPRDLRRAPARSRRVALLRAEARRRSCARRAPRRRSSITSPPARRRPRRHAPARRSRGTSWARAGWATIPRTSVVDRVAALPRRREHAVHRLVGVPDLDRLRPDAHDRRARDPRAVASSPGSRPCAARDGRRKSDAGVVVLHRRDGVHILLIHDRVREQDGRGEVIVPGAEVYGRAARNVRLHVRDEPDVLRPPVNARWPGDRRTAIRAL